MPVVKSDEDREGIERSLKKIAELEDLGVIWRAARDPQLPHNFTFAVKQAWCYIKRVFQKLRVICDARHINAGCRSPSRTTLPRVRDVVEMVEAAAMGSERMISSQKAWAVEQVKREVEARGKAGWGSFVEGLDSPVHARSATAKRTVVAMGKVDLSMAYYQLPTRMKTQWSVSDGERWLCYESSSSSMGSLASLHHFQACGRLLRRILSSIQLACFWTYIDDVIFCICCHINPLEAVHQWTCATVVKVGFACSEQKAVRQCTESEGSGEQHIEGVTNTVRRDSEFEVLGVAFRRSASEMRIGISEGRKKIEDDLASRGDPEECDDHQEEIFGGSQEST